VRPPNVGKKEWFGPVMIRSMDQPAMSRPIVQKLRGLCLRFPETRETASWGHPNFRAGKRIFSAFEIVKGRPSIAFRLEAAEVDRLLRKKNFFATPYGGGRWVSVWVDGAIDWRLVARLLDRSYQVVANKRMIAALAATRG
jgi:predicted DNA-binding protein (MmcQ/YjbR family)